MHVPLLLIGVFLDQFSKYLVHQFLHPGESIPLIPQVLHLTHHTNTGAAFGLFGGSNGLLVGVSIVLILCTYLWYIRSHHRIEGSGFRLGLTFVIAGALGNLSDRIRLGFVVDFIDFRVWPIFNVADSLITIGALVALMSLIKRRREY